MKDWAGVGTRKRSAPLEIAGPCRGFGGFGLQVGASGGQGRTSGSGAEAPHQLGHGDAFVRQAVGEWTAHLRNRPLDLARLRTIEASPKAGVQLVRS